MNTMKLPSLLVVTALCFAAGALRAQPFDAGSDGSYGAINLTTTDQTLDLPADGIFRCTTINVNTARTLRFKRNALNTPVYLLASGDVTIAGGISVDGERGTGITGGSGGPGGFAGGQPGSIGASPGDGHGPGGGKAGTNANAVDGAGAGGFATKPSSGSTTRHGRSYGSPLLLPLVGGSGGGGTVGTPGVGGGGGGGAILIASSTRISLTGAIRARGAYIAGSAFNYGSGGSVRLVAPVITGNGIVNAQQGEGNFSGGEGRIRVDTQDRSQLALNLQPASTTTVGSLMLVFPAPLPRLDFTEVAGTAIAVDSGPVRVNLPFGSPGAQKVKVQAKDFGQVVPIRIVLTPDNGVSTSYDAEINNAAANPASVTVDVQFPVNVQTAVDVWTR